MAVPVTCIVQLANFYGPETGGLKTVLEELARCYTDAGIDRVLIAPGPTDAQEFSLTGRRIFLRAPVLPGSGGYRIIMKRRQLHQLLDALQPDAIEVSDKLTLLAAASWARARGIPCILLSHERIDAILRSRLPRFVPLPRLANAWNRRLSRTFDGIVCPSRFAEAEFRRIGAPNSAVVPWGVDLETFTPGFAVPGRPRARCELICIGRLSKEKDPQMALDVVGELQRRGLDVHLTMVGSGPMAAQLERQAVGLPVTFTGHVDTRSEVAALLAGADVTLALCRAETFGLAVLESLACGTPVVTSDEGAASEVCGPGCGTAAPFDAALLADAVVTLLAKDRATVRQRARARAEEFPWSAAADAILSIEFGDREAALCA